MDSCTSELVSRISSDTLLVQEAIGDKVIFSSQEESLVYGSFTFQFIFTNCDDVGSVLNICWALLLGNENNCAGRELFALHECFCVWHLCEFRNHLAADSRDSFSATFACRSRRRLLSDTSSSNQVEPGGLL